ncbi:VWA domain-containing protein [Paludibaculum fermentans]|uniref:VWA domain-containing protein n=1 Tax=Paludibaculum fermentans TaxID=1473598 RepID=UPI003EBFDDCC
MKPMLRRGFLCSLSSMAWWSPPAFRTEVSLVRVDCEVTDGTRTIDGLIPADFAVLDNGQPQTIRVVSQGEEPLDIVLVFDVSGSMAGSIARVRKGARNVLAQMKAGDRVALTEFSGRSVQVLPLCSNMDQVAQVIETHRTSRWVGVGTALLGAVEAARKVLARERRASRRRAILVVTDNFGNAKRPNQDALVVRLWETDASVHGVLVGPYLWLQKQRRAGRAFPPSMMRREEMASHLDDVAEKTGGTLLGAEQPEDDFARLMERIRRRYSIYYDMPQGRAGEKRTVRVELSESGLIRHPGARAQARKGYVLPEKR